MVLCSWSLVGRSNVGLTGGRDLAARENDSALTHHRFDSTFWRRWRILRSHPLGSQWRGWRRSGDNIVDFPHRLYAWPIPLRATTTKDHGRGCRCYSQPHGCILKTGNVRVAFTGSVTRLRNGRFPPGSKTIVFGALARLRGSARSVQRPLIQGARLFVVKDGPHCVTWTHADEVNRQLVEFLGEGIGERTLAAFGVEAVI